MKSNLIFENGNIRYKDKIYEEREYGQLLKVIGKNIRIIILGEKLFVKSYKVDKKLLNSYIKEVYENEISYSVDLLMDYKFVKNKNKLYTYTLKKSPNINKILINAKKLEVMPVQYILLKYVKKQIKLINDYLIVAMINNKIYVVNIEKDLIREANTLDFDEINLLKNNYITDINKTIIIDKSLLNYINLDDYNGRFIKINIGDKVYEKLCKI